jgi:hypothetical protein
VAFKDFPAMRSGPLADHGLAHAARVSPVSISATLLIFILIAAGILASLATGFTLQSLPNILLVVIGVLVLDVLIQFARPNKLTTRALMFLYGLLYLITACVCGVLAAYAMQRAGFPLRDHALNAIDLALGFDWPAYAHWVDRHPLVQSLLYPAYHSISLQIALPVLVLAAAGRLDELRLYLLAFAIAFITTIFISATMPAVGPIVFADRNAFDILRFTGATPVEHLNQLRASGPLVMTEFPGGIATFPSFHSTVAVLTPLALRRHRIIFAALLLLNAAMLAGTLTEGGHYLIDVIAGCAMAAFGFMLARPVIRLEDRLMQRRAKPARDLTPATA